MTRTAYDACGSGRFSLILLCLGICKLSLRLWPRVLRPRNGNGFQQRMDSRVILPIPFHRPTSKPLRLPTLGRPLRICIEGPLPSIQMLLPELQWILDISKRLYPQQAGPELVRSTYEKIYEKVYERILDPEANGDLKVWGRSVSGAVRINE
jgi:hypothetical protein